MLWHIFDTRSQEQVIEDVPPASRSLQVVLWTLWTLAVVAVGYADWHTAAAAQRPVDTLGLVIHCVLAGLIGLIVMTKIEMWLEPWRFVD